MLTKESSRGFPELVGYPAYEYHSRSGKGRRARMDLQRIIPCPRGYREVVRYADVNAHFTAYVEGLQEEHEGIPDSKFLEHPWGIFIGQWRNARWQDEAQRRGLVEK